MTIGVLNFERIEQNLHNLAEGEQAVMISRVFFNFSTNDGKVSQSMFADISQPYGTSFGEEPFETGIPFLCNTGEYPTEPTNGPYQFVPYKGPWNHNDFSDIAERYYRSLIGSSGAHINVPNNSSSVTMGSNTLVQSYRGSMKVERDTKGPW